MSRGSGDLDEIGTTVSGLLRRAMLVVDARDALDRIPLKRRRSWEGIIEQTISDIGGVRPPGRIGSSVKIATFSGAGFDAAGSAVAAAMRLKRRLDARRWGRI